jgi:hypothetical protein
MRPLAALALSALLLAGCKREAKEAVAEAKGAAEQAKRSAEEAATRGKAAADDAAARARMAAADANARVGQLGQSIQQGVRELGAGDVIVGTLTESTASQVSVRIAQNHTVPIATDAQTRWVLRGASGGQAGIPTGSFVRITYIVRDGQKLATQVETATP